MDLREGTAICLLIVLLAPQTTITVSKDYATQVSMRRAARTRMPR
jgi:hypothetical protein